MRYRSDRGRDGTASLHPQARIDVNSNSMPGNTSTKYLSEIDHYVDNLQELLWPLNRYIHDNPELAFEEHKAHNALTRFMQTQEGWQVTPSAYGIETAWVASYDNGRPGPVASFNAEYGLSSLRSPVKDKVANYSQTRFQISVMPVVTT
jgi:hypothetical protein